MFGSVFLDDAFYFFFAFWGFGFQTEGFSTAIAATVIVILIVVRSLYRKVFRPIVLLRIDNIPKILVTSFKSVSTITVMDAPVKKSHSQHLTAWVSHAMECKNCKSKYAIYTPSREEKAAGSWTKNDLSKNELDSMLESAVKKKQPPINGCPKCYNTDHISQEALDSYNIEAKENNRYAVIFLIFGGVGAYCVYFLTSNNIIKPGLLVDSVKLIGGTVPFTFLEVFIVGGSIVLSSLYASYRLFSRKKAYGLKRCTLPSTRV